MNQAADDGLYIFDLRIIRFGMNDSISLKKASFHGSTFHLNLIYINVGLKDMLPIIEMKCIAHLVAAVLQGILPFCIFTAHSIGVKFSGD